MSGENYQHDWWAIVYDQWNEQGCRRAHEREFEFCRSQLYGSPDGAPYDCGEEMGLTYWVVEGETRGGSAVGASVARKLAGDGL